MREKYAMPMLMSARDIQSMGISRTKAYELLGNSELPVICIGKRKFIHRDDFFDWLEAREKKPCEEDE